MFLPGILENRFESSFRYLDYLEKAKNKDWIDAFHFLESMENFGLPEILALLNPKWYENLLILPKINDPRGATSFSSSPVKQPCASEKYWGYICPMTSEIIHTDHIFPWSRGGATHFQNATYLCDEHNKMKFTDIHTMPWEVVFEAKDWVRISLQLMIEQAKKITSEKLFFPETQFSRN